MPYRNLMIGEVEHHVDVSTGVQAIHTPWGIVTAQADDVLVPHGNAVVPIPQRLLDQLLAGAGKPIDNAPAGGERSNGAEGKAADAGQSDVDLDAMSRQALIKFAAKKFPKAMPWVTMETDAIKAWLRGQGH